MNNEQYLTQLINYISENMSRGVSRNDIYAALINSGWDQQFVIQAFERADTCLAVQPPLVEQNETTLPDCTIESSNITPHPSDKIAKYKLVSAVKDTAKALVVNPVTFLLTFLSSIVISFFSSILLILLAYVPLTIIKTTSRSNILALLFAYSLVLVISIIWSSLIQAYFLTSTSLILSESRSRKKASFKKIATLSLTRLFRVVKVNLVTVTVLAWPFFLLIFVAIFEGLASGRAIKILVFLVYLAILVFAIVRVIMGLVRYALAPYVAIFEPETPIIKTLSRSRVLLSGGGNRFIVKLFFLALFMLIVIAGVSGASVQAKNYFINMMANIMALVVSVFINGMLLMLYANRRSIKS